MLTAEQLVAAQKANLETLFELTNKAFEGVEKLVELNLQVAKASIGEVQSTATAALGVKDAQELLSLQAGLLQPAAEKAAAYGRHLYDIAASTNAEVSKIAEAQVASAQSKFNSAVKNAPAGTESAAALVKSAIAAATNAMESVQKATKQAADVAEANFQTLTNTAVKATAAPAKAAKKTAA